MVSINWYNPNNNCIGGIVMKKRIIAIFLIAMVLIPSFAIADSSDIGILINNKIRIIPKDMGEAFSSNSRTFVPLRFVSENLGFKVDWEQETQTAIVHSRDGEIRVTIGKETITTPDGEVKMDVVAFIRDGRTYVPVRFVAETLGFKVDWIPAREVEGSKAYPYGHYVSIEGELGDSITSTSDTHNITNIVSDDPKDWPETTNRFQEFYDLAKNKAFIEYMEANHKGKYHVAGYTITDGNELGPALTYNRSGARDNSFQDLIIFDLRDYANYWQVGVYEYSQAKDVLEKSLYAIVGQEEGSYIFELYDKGQTEPIPSDKWLETPNGTEFYIDTIQPSGVFVYIKTK